MKRITTLFVLSLLAFPAFTQEVNTARIDSFIGHIEQYNQGIGEIAIARSGKSIYNRRFGNPGFCKIDDQQKPRYRIGSITKLFTATLIHRLIEAGRLDADVTLDNYFPEIPNARKITIAHLLNHTSGLGNYIIRGDSLWSITNHLREEDILDEIMAQGCSFLPGEKEQYSNSGYYLLTKILEKEYNRKYPQIISEQILSPLNMFNTFSGIDEDPAIVPSCHLNTDHEWKKSKEFYFPNVTGLGDLISTPEDLNIFLDALFMGKLFPKDRVQMMMPKGQEMYGQGIQQAPYNGQVLYGHGGATLGTRSIAFYDMETNIAVSVIVNGINAPFEDILVGIMNGIYDIPFQFKNYSRHQKYKADKGRFELYEGSYESVENSAKFFIYRKGNNLMIKLPKEPETCLEAHDVDKFLLSPAGVIIEFKPESNCLLYIWRKKTIKFFRSTPNHTVGLRRLRTKNECGERIDAWQK